MKVYYQKETVSVDEHFARFGSKAFAVNKVTSVDMRTEYRPASMAWLIVFLIGSLIGLMLLTNRSVIFGFIMLVSSGAISYLMHQRSTSSEIFRLFLVTSSTETQVYATLDKDDILELRQAIEAAVSASA